jgi:predicted nucleic acid-binding protein
VPEIFADSFYWIALANPTDASHRTALEFSQASSHSVLVTTDEVLTEFLNYFSAAGEPKRRVVGMMVEETMNHSRIIVLPQTRDSLLNGFALYKARGDKRYSLTDCISMATMVERNITKVLTHDQHFAQEGFTVLF